jgi:serine/threonine protein phosphatase 1
MKISGRTFAISDIHGCARTFQKLVQEVIHLQKSDNLYLIGDFIDRGNDSKGVVDFILHLQEEGHHLFLLRGNHEQLMMDSVNDKETFTLWIKNGGDQTLKSFGIKSYNDLPLKYQSFFEKTEHCLTYEKFIIVHAGLNFNNDNLFEDVEAMLWTRDMKIDKQKLGNRLIVHGHTPLPLDSILSQNQQGAVNIDGGCVYHKAKGYGYLVAYNLTEGTFHYARNVEGDLYI